jgi:D-tyrosyl-tRNA(Tyr) deacylase
MNFFSTGRQGIIHGFQQDVHIMKTIIQRVSSAFVTIDGKVAASIGKGLLLLVGFGHQEEVDALDWMARKTTGLRVFNDDEGKMNLSVQDVGGEILIVSQFTLYGDARKGNRPSFVEAGRPEESEPLYDQFVRKIKEIHPRTTTGSFGADMKVSLVNDGPVTLILER